MLYLQQKNRPFMDKNSAFIASYLNYQNRGGGYSGGDAGAGCFIWFIFIVIYLGFVLLTMKSPLLSYIIGIGLMTWVGAPRPFSWSGMKARWKELLKCYFGFTLMWGTLMIILFL